MPSSTTSSVAPHGQSEVGAGARDAETLDEARRRVTMHELPSDIGRPARSHDADVAGQGARRDQAVRRPAGRQQRRLRHPARLDRVAHRPERRRQDDVLQHDHRATTSRPPARSRSTASRSSRPRARRSRSLEAARGDGARDRPDVPEHPAVRDDVGARQRPGRHQRPPQEPLVGLGRCARPSMLREEQAVDRRGMRLLEARRPRRAVRDVGAQPAVRRPAPARDRPRARRPGRSSSCSTSRPPA